MRRATVVEHDHRLTLPGVLIRDRQSPEVEALQRNPPSHLWSLRYRRAAQQPGADGGGQPLSFGTAAFRPADTVSRCNHGT
jgi:hypothetical protein